MKIFDLTRGKYPSIYSTIYDWGYAEGVERMAQFSRDFNSLFANGKNDIGALLNNIPVFLVESSVSNEYVAVPGCQCLVRVPEDSYVSSAEDEDFDIDDWVDSKEDDARKKDNPLERTSRSIAITDLLGVYIFTNNEDIIPRRIFIWMDKIVNYVKRNSRTQIKAEQNAYAHVLFDLVLYHEMSHALMDVELYDVHPAPSFSYADEPYRYIEEAYANGIALTILMDEDPDSKSVKSLQKLFIKQFVKSQGAGYSDGLELSDGWEIYSDKKADVKVSQWLGIKALFNYEIAVLLRAFWQHKDFNKIDCYEGVGHDGWIAVKDYLDKWGIIELPSQKAVAGFKKYDCFWSFNEHGLCKVILNNLYGYVNEQGVEQIPVEYDILYENWDGIFMAFKNGKCAAIDVNNQVVIPFSRNPESVNKKIQKLRISMKKDAKK